MADPYNTQQDLAKIKAGVQGMLDDVPVPSPGDMGGEAPLPQTMTSGDAAPLPQTSVSGGGFETSFQTGNPSVPYGAEPLPASPGSTLDMEAVHQIVEAIINERWDDFMGSVGNIALWKERTERELISVKQELLRVQQRFTQIETALLGKVGEYQQDIKSVHTEMRALEKVFERILEPLTSNIKELGKLTEELKSVRPRTP